MTRPALRQPFGLAGLALAALVGACAAGDEPIDMRRDARVPPSPDLGPRDLGNTELGSTDLGEPEMGVEDLGNMDLGGVDSGTTDLGVADLGATDLGATDLGPASDGGPLGAYRHTITIDGVNDFDAARERLDTTTASYSFYVSWDAAALYLGFDGSDVASGSGTKWALVYLDTNGAGSGTAVGVRYNTQTPALPPGLVADYVFRWRTDNTLQSVQRWDTPSSMWVETSIALSTFQSGSFVETRIAFVELGSPSTLGVAALMLNEAAGFEYSYAGAPAGTFTDGFYSTIPMTRWLSADRSVATNPNDTTRLRP